MRKTRRLSEKHLGRRHQCRFSVPDFSHQLALGFGDVCGRDRDLGSRSSLQRGPWRFWGGRCHGIYLRCSIYSGKKPSRPEERNGYKMRRKFTPAHSVRDSSVPATRRPGQLSWLFLYLSLLWARFIAWPTDSYFRHRLASYHRRYRVNEAGNSVSLPLSYFRICIVGPHGATKPFGYSGGVPRPACLVARG